MGTSRSIALASVRKEQLEEAIGSLGRSWEDANHVTATGSLRRALRSQGALAHSVITLIDLLVLPQIDDDGILPVYPKASLFGAGRGNYEAAEQSWRSRGKGMALAESLQFDQELRDHLDRHEHGTPSELRDLLRRERRTLRKTIQALNAAGVFAEDLEAEVGSMEPMAQLAVRSWRAIQKSSRWLTAYRDCLWVDLDDYRAQATAESRRVRSHLLSALDLAFGSVDGRRLIVHHGFYFFTPPQWALFQLIDATPEVDQLFVIHDDGASPAFEIWRRFHSEKWDMPAVERHLAQHREAGPARVLRSALAGEPLGEIGSTDHLKVVECDSPIEFARRLMATRLASSTIEAPPQLFAANEAEIRGIISIGTDQDDESSSLLALPLGAFLTSLLGCIEVSSRGIDVEITEAAVRDCVSSGFIGHGTSSESATALFGRTSPFFRGCRDPQSWRDRATALRRLCADASPDVRDRVPGERALWEGIADNPIRLAPWADLSLDEGVALESMVHAMADRVAALAAVGRARLVQLFGLVRDDIQRGLKSASPRIVEELEGRVAGLSSSSAGEADIEGLVDLVSILLGGEVDIDSIGDEEQDHGSIVQPIRNLDALGFRPSEVGIELANLSADNFPSGAQAVGWPFRMSDLGDSVPTITREILEERELSAALGDLYLLWLAADGVAEQADLTISWISESSSGRRNLAGVVNLMVAPESEVIRRVSGGADVVRSATSAGVDSISEPIVLVGGPSDLSTPPDLDRLFGRIPAAAGIACPRRLALQWALGASAAYRGEHQQSMLYGNLRNALSTITKMEKGSAWLLVDDLWRHLSPGQRASSARKAVVQGNRSGAKPQWIFTLKGNWNSNDGLSSAYRRAAGQGTPWTGELADDRILPEGSTDSKVCSMCPVNDRCLVRSHQIDE